MDSWYFEVWNEPDIGYWHGTPEEYQKLYDFAADGLKRAVPTAKIGGPHVTSPSGPRPQQMLRGFLEHCLRGTNFATGKIGSPLDYIGFHAKGAPRVVDGHVRMGVSNQLRAIAGGFEIVALFPELKRTPIIIGESDPEGCAACSVRTNPENAYRNGTVYSSYTAEQIARSYELADLHGVNLRGAVTWAFEFEDQPYFAGFRDLATNGIDKPVLNVFRMLGRMAGNRVAVESTGPAARQIRDAGVRDQPDVSALASRSVEPSPCCSGTITTTTCQRRRHRWISPSTACPDSVRVTDTASTPTTQRGRGVEADGATAAADSGADSDAETGGRAEAGRGDAAAAGG